ncbi:MAG TPA: XRE family transcriptional regulator [Mucilaginibacter sp.]|nr:XRE family transcriptional regulator [Mucilaginibacter sp.]
MKKVIFTVEKTEDGYSAFHVAPGMGTAATFGDNITELRHNVLEAYNALLFDRGKKQVSGSDIVLQHDLSQFFEYYNIINAGQLAARVGMNRALLSQYIHGQKKPSVSQINKILQGVRALGNELTQIELV